MPMGDEYFTGKTLREINNDVVSNIERRAIELCLEKNGWNRKRTSKDLGISYRCLLYKIQDFGLKPDAKGEEDSAVQTVGVQGEAAA